MHKTTQRQRMALFFTCCLMALLTACASSATPPTGGIGGIGAAGTAAQGGATTAAGSGATATATTASSTPVGSQSGADETITYASIELTALSVDQEKTFADDTNSSSPLLLRINFKEQNTTADTVYPSYSENMRLILPDGKTIVPDEVQTGSGIEQAVLRTNWVDFPVDSKVDLNTASLQLGAPTESQMLVPLTKNPDLSKYQPKTITPNSKLKYGVDWTVTKVTASWSANGKQALTGKRYIQVALQADNATADTFYPSISDNLRLKSDGAIQAPEVSTVPGSFAANSTGATGIVTFLMPQDSSSFTLDFLAQSSSNIAEATTTFQIP